MKYDLDQFEFISTIILCIFLLPFVFLYLQFKISEIEQVLFFIIGAHELKWIWMDF